MINFISAVFVLYLKNLNFIGLISCSLYAAGYNLFAQKPIIYINFKNI